MKIIRKHDSFYQDNFLIINLQWICCIQNKSPQFVLGTLQSGTHYSLWFSYSIIFMHHIIPVCTLSMSCFIAFVLYLKQGGKERRDKITHMCVPGIKPHVANPSYNVIFILLPLNLDQVMSLTRLLHWSFFSNLFMSFTFWTLKSNTIRNVIK